MIPKIMMFYINPNTTNIIKNYLKDDSYFFTKNKFKLNYLKIGPFTTVKKLKLVVNSLIMKNIIFTNSTTRIEKKEDDKYFFIFEFNSDSPINYDLNFLIYASGIKFYLWINLWYHAIENISDFIYFNKLYLKDGKSSVENNLKQKEKRHLSFVEMKNLYLDYKDIDEDLNEKFDSKNFCINSNDSINSIENLKEYLLDNENECVKTNYKIKVFNDSSDNLISLIQNLKIDQDLNKFTEGVNELCKVKNILEFDKGDLNINLTASQLDKFSNAKKMHKDFILNLNFKLIN